MFFHYESNMELDNEEKEDFLEFLKLMEKRPIATFFFYQIDEDCWGTDMGAFFYPGVKTFYQDLHVILEGKEKTMVCVVLPIIIYFFIYRFFKTLFKWRKYKREIPLIILKML